MEQLDLLGNWRRRSFRRWIPAIEIYIIISCCYCWRRASRVKALLVEIHRIDPGSFLFALRFSNTPSRGSFKVEFMLMGNCLALFQLLMLFLCLKKVLPAHFFLIVFAEKV